MTELYSARKVAEEALRKIGALTPHDNGADGNEFNIALSSLDIVLGHYLTPDNFTFLIPATTSITLTGGTAAYALSSAMGSNWPQSGVFYVKDAYLLTDGANPAFLEKIRRDEYDKLDATETGTPCKIYLDRSDPSEITLRTWPTLGSGVTGRTINLTIQKFPATISGTNVIPEVRTDLPAAWNMWSIYQLAAYLGDGTIRRLSNSDIADFRDVAEKLLNDLKGFTDDEHANDEIAEPWGQ